MPRFPFRIGQRGCCRRALDFNHEPSFFDSVQRNLGAHMHLRERGLLVQTNVASLLATGLSGPPALRAGRECLSGFTHPLKY